MIIKIVYFLLLANAICHVLSLPRLDESEKNLVKLLNKIDKVESLPLFGGLRVDRVSGGSRQFSSTKNLESLEARAEQYLSTHELNFSFPEEEEDEQLNGRSLPESRGKKMKKMLVPLLLALKLKKAVILKVLFMIIKFISLKSLAISLLALIFSAGTFFKDLLSKKKEHITTAYITGSPLNAELVHSDWNRNGQVAASELAYNHYGLAQPF